MPSLPARTLLGFPQCVDVHTRPYLLYNYCGMLEAGHSNFQFMYFTQQLIYSLKNRYEGRCCISVLVQIWSSCQYKHYYAWKIITSEVGKIWRSFPNSVKDCAVWKIVSVHCTLYDLLVHNWKFESEPLVLILCVSVHHEQSRIVSQHLSKPVTGGLNEDMCKRSLSIWCSGRCERHESEKWAR